VGAVFPLQIPIAPQKPLQRFERGMFAIRIDPRDKRFTQLGIVCLAGFLRD